jgi:hypothetical protein
MTDEELDRLIAVALQPERERKTLEERVQLLEDHLRISDLVMLYGWLCDRRDWDELLDHYTDDFERTLLGTLNETAKGKERLRELYVKPELPRKDGSSGAPPPAAQIAGFELRHLIHPPVIRIGDDHRTATAAASYSLVVSTGDGAAFRRGEHEGGYIFGFRREPVHGWRFCTMVVISENARNPLFANTAA